MRVSTKTTFLLGFFLYLVACRGAAIRPVDLEAGDSCSFCKMAMSGREFAAEFIPPGGEALKFDDIGCSQAYLKEHPELTNPTIFVNDFDSKKWLSATEAWFVKAEAIKTPMGGGIIAFSTREKAEAAAAKYSGAVSRSDAVYRGGTQ